MRRSIVLAIVLFGGAAGPVAGAPRHTATALHRLCSINHPCGHCPRGEWMCAGKCIPDRQACAPF
ncbi:MAG TPA: hypothetical protein VKT30_07825 [Caulobacteraceae bacterium]|nr:hypothetical protein [Caulobacteraceae bacterium]